MLGLCLSIVAGVAFFLALGCGSAAMLMADGFVSAAHRSHHEDWVALGSPAGFLWYAPEAGPFSGRLSVHRRLLSWLRDIPEWAEGDPELVGWLRRYRKTGRATVALLAICVIAVVLAQGA